MIITEIKDKNRWNEFIAGQTHSRFLQTWQWGEFQQKSGARIYRLGGEEAGELKVAAQLVKIDLLGNYGYLYCPGGPIMNLELRIQNSELATFLFEAISKKAENEQALFLRFEPDRDFKIQNSKFKILKSIDIQPPKTLIMDLSQSEDELLGNMRQKTRYNIRLAEKKGVRVRQGGTGDFERFWGLMAETLKRDNFRLHPKKYYEAMLAVDGVKLYLAEYAGQIIAGGIMIFFGDTATYMHGASANAERNVMAPFLLQWAAIKEAKSANCRFYDFYGIDDKRWPGVTRFKMGFGGQELIRPGTFDLVFNNPAYHLYLAARKLRRAI